MGVSGKSIADQLPMTASSASGNLDGCAHKDQRTLTFKRTYEYSRHK